MCYSKAEGGQRCAAHTLAALDRATAALQQAPHDTDVQRSYREALVDYASTPQGRERLNAARARALDGGDNATAEQLLEVICSGQAKEADAVEARELACQLADRQADYDKLVLAFKNRRHELGWEPGSRDARHDGDLAYLELTEAGQRLGRARAAFDATEPGQALLKQELRSARRAHDVDAIRDLQVRQRAAAAFHTVQAELRTITGPSPLDFSSAEVWASAATDSPGERDAAWRALEEQARAHDAELVARGAITQAKATRKAALRSHLRQDILDRAGAAVLDPANPQLAAYRVAFRGRTAMPLAS